jgi:hypothetical protein
MVEEIEERSREAVRAESLTIKEKIIKSQQELDGLDAKIKELSEEISQEEIPFKPSWSLFRRKKSSADSYFESSDKAEQDKKKGYLENLKNKSGELDSQKKEALKYKGILAEIYIRKIDLFPGSKDLYETTFDCKTEIVDTQEPDKGISIFNKNIPRKYMGNGYHKKAVKSLDVSSVSKQFIMDEGIVALVNVTHSGNLESNSHYGLPVKKVQNS